LSSIATGYIPPPGEKTPISQLLRSYHLDQCFLDDPGIIHFLSLPETVRPWLSLVRCPYTFKPSAWSSLTKAGSALEQATGVAADTKGPDEEGLDDDLDSVGEDIAPNSSRYESAGSGKRRVRVCPWCYIVVNNKSTSKALR